MPETEIQNSFFAQRRVILLQYRSRSCNTILFFEGVPDAGSKDKRDSIPFLEREGERKKEKRERDKKGRVRKEKKRREGE